MELARERGRSPAETDERKRETLMMKQKRIERPATISRKHSYFSCHVLPTNVGLISYKGMSE